MSNLLTILKVIVFLIIGIALIMFYLDEFTGWSKKGQQKKLVYYTLLIALGSFGIFYILAKLFE